MLLSGKKANAVEEQQRPVCSQGDVVPNTSLLRGLSNSCLIPVRNRACACTFLPIPAKGTENPIVCYSRICFCMKRLRDPLNSISTPATSTNFPSESEGKLPAVASREGGRFIAQLSRCRGGAYTHSTDALTALFNFLFRPLGFAWRGHFSSTGEASHSRGHDPVASARLLCLVSDLFFLFPYALCPVHRKHSQP